jgi:hypothetical protein
MNSVVNTDNEYYPPAIREQIELMERAAQEAYRPWPNVFGMAQVFLMRPIDLILPTPLMIPGGGYTTSNWLMVFWADLPL